MRRPLVEPDHGERARVRAKREFHSLVTNTVRFVLWVGLWTISAAAIGLYFSWGHGKVATVAITAVAAVVGFGGAFAIPFVWLWLTAPVVQRNEARDEILRLTAKPGFPDLVIDADGLSQEDTRDGGLVIVLSSMLVMNREAFPTNLQFRLGVMDSDGNEFYSTFPELGYTKELGTPGRRYALSVPAGKMETPTLRFVITPQDHQAIMKRLNVTPVEGVPPRHMRLWVNERGSGRSIPLQVPSFYPPLASR